MTASLTLVIKRNVKGGDLMKMYHIDENANKTRKSSFIIKEWFHLLEEKYDYYFQNENKVDNYTKRDLDIAMLIANKRQDGWSYNKIFDYIEEIYHLTKHDEIKLK